MNIKPDQYAPLLEYHYAEIRDWAQNGRMADEIADLEPLLTQYQDIITEWVEHNERVRDHTMSKRLADRAVVGYVEFWESEKLWS